MLCSGYSECCRNKEKKKEDLTQLAHTYNCVRRVERQSCRKSLFLRKERSNWYHFNIWCELTTTAKTVLLVAICCRFGKLLIQRFSGITVTSRSRRAIMQKYGAMLALKVSNFFGGRIGITSLPGISTAFRQLV